MSFQNRLFGPCLDLPDASGRSWRNVAGGSDKLSVRAERHGIPLPVVTKESATLSGRGLDDLHRAIFTRRCQQLAVRTECDRSHDPFMVTTRPRIMALEPDRGIVGSRITIRGENFPADRALVQVRLQEIECEVVSAARDNLVGIQAIES